MTRIIREPALAADEVYDVVIVGGGIYGAMLLLIAAAHDLKTILIEKNDFGSGVSFNSLRIIHGGLRYLQSLNLRQSDTMIAERAWFLKNFPELIAHLPCLMPLYNRGLRRRSTMGLALWLDNLLSKRSNAALEGSRHIPPGRIISLGQVEQLFPLVNRAGLQGGAIWHDARVPDSQRLLMETLRWSVSMGAGALNYVEAGDLLISRTGVEGVVGYDRLSDENLEFRAKVVINAAGPANRVLAARYDQDIPGLFRPSLAWNILFDRPQISDHAIAVSKAGRSEQVYFLLPWKGKLVVGTGHGAVRNERDTVVTADQLKGMINDINEAVPDLGLRTGEVTRVFSGLLPVRTEGTVDLNRRGIIHDHGQNGGPQGLFSVSGVKLVAAHAVAVRTVRAACRRFFPGKYQAFSTLQTRPEPAKSWDSSVLASGAKDILGQHQAGLKKIIEDESVIHLDDLVLRRTTLWEQPAALLKTTRDLASLFPWDVSRQDREISRLEAALQSSTAQKPDSAD